MQIAEIIAALISLLMLGFGQMYSNQFIKDVIFVVIQHFDNTLEAINKAIQ